MSVISPKFLQSDTRKKLQNLRHQQREAQVAYEAQIADLNRDAAAIVAECPHDVVLRDEADYEETVCVECGARSNNEDDQFTETDERTLFDVDGSDVDEATVFQLGSKSLVR